MKLAHKAIHEVTWPSYVNLEMVSYSKLLRSNRARTLKLTLESGTFQDSASKLFNNLPIDLRNCSDYTSFSKETKALLLNQITDFV